MYVDSLTTDEMKEFRGILYWCVARKDGGGTCSLIRCVWKGVQSMLRTCSLKRCVLEFLQEREGVRGLADSGQDEGVPRDMELVCVCVQEGWGRMCSLNRCV